MVTLINDPNGLEEMIGYTLMNFFQVAAANSICFTDGVGGKGHPKESSGILNGTLLFENFPL